MKKLKLDPCFLLFWCENSTQSVSLVGLFAVLAFKIC